MKHWEHHPEPVEGCFGCKGLSLQMNTGDAHSQRSMPTKAFNKRLSTSIASVGLNGGSHSGNNHLIL